VKERERDGEREGGKERERERERERDGEGDTERARALDRQKCRKQAEMPKSQPHGTGTVQIYRKSLHI